MASQIDLIRQKAEASLKYFAHLINPHRSYGVIHDELFDWWTRPTALDNQLVLLPRDHLKSHSAAVRCAWEITKDPTSTHLYISSTEGLAIDQLYAIKGMLTSDIYKRYWPGMINEDEGKRERWTVKEIIVDDPKRKLAAPRDPTVQVKGLTAGITGSHCTHAWLDDLVEPRNAYTEEGRARVAALYAQLASIETTGSREVVVGTRYFPTDLYQYMLDLEEESFNSEMEVVGHQKVYEVFERVVEKDGVFLWPKHHNSFVNRPFGFDARELARKRAKYSTDMTQFYAQYYNNPNDPSMDRIGRSKFQYYDPRFLEYLDGYWSIRNQRLNLYAAVDFGLSTGPRSDYSSVVVVGMTSTKDIYVMDIVRFKTDKISEYYRNIFDMHRKWGFRKIRAECTQAQGVIVKDLKDNYITKQGLALSVDEFHPTRHLGSKEERVSAILEPRYDNMQVWHYRGGYCTFLEEELILAKPPHDDIKDALASAIDIAMPPVFAGKSRKDNVIHHPRFGGVAFR